MAIPQQIGRYLIRRELGRGGMATVYLAHDPRFGRDVALKALPREFLHDPQFRGRFEREVQTIARLEHPAIVPVYDAGEEDGLPYLVMRYMAGGSLHDRMHAGRLAIPQIVEIAQRIGEALDYAHSQGLVHRDLKPGNILFDHRGNAYLADFGIVKVLEATATLTSSGAVGTPPYMSPEQIHGDKTIDGRSDLYSLGIIVFQMLAGRVPYEGDSPPKVMMAHLLQPIPRLRDVRAELSTGWQPALDKALAKEREHRFPTAGDFARALAAVARREPLGGEPSPSPLPPTEVAPPALPSGRPRWLAQLGLAGAALLALFILAACAIATVYLARNAFASPAPTQGIANTTATIVATIASTSPAAVVASPTAAPTRTTAPTATPATAALVTSPTAETQGAVSDDPQLRQDVTTFLSHSVAVQIEAVRNGDSTILAEVMSGDALAELVAGIDEQNRLGLYQVWEFDYQQSFIGEIRTVDVSQIEVDTCETWSSIVYRLDDGSQVSTTGPELLPQTMVIDTYPWGWTISQVTFYDPPHFCPD
jgi:serine/threonine-protein kinase